MRDPGRRGKRRDLRRSFQSGDGFSALSFYCLHHRGSKLWWGSARAGQYSSYDQCDCPSFEICDNLETEWIRKHIGVSRWEYGGGRSPAHYRRSLNRLQRAREKFALQKAFRDNDWDDFFLPLNRFCYDV